MRKNPEVKNMERKRHETKDKDGNGGRYDQV